MIFTNTKCIGHYPVGFAAIIVADNAFQAADLLNKELVEHGLPMSAVAENMIPFDISKPRALILVNGNY